MGLKSFVEYIKQWNIIKYGIWKMLNSKSDGEKSILDSNPSLLVNSLKEKYIYFAAVTVHKFCLA